MKNLLFLVVFAVSLFFLQLSVNGEAAKRKSTYKPIKKWYLPAAKDLYPEVSPYRNKKDKLLELLYTAPWESKGLCPVKITFNKNIPALTIAENGTPKVKIIIAKDSAYYRQCAELIKVFLDVAMDADFQIVVDSGAKQKGIYIGPCKNSTSQKIYKKAQKLKANSLIVESFADGIAIGGRDGDPAYGFKKNLPARYQKISVGPISYDRGTFMATLDFLERLIGVRWYCPGRVGIFVPDLRKEIKIIPALAYQDEPVFNWRSGTGELYNAKDAMHTVPSLKRRYDMAYYHKSRKSFNKPIVRYRGGVHPVLRKSSIYSLNMGNHTDQHWNEFFLDTPEIFAVREKDGTRMLGKKGHQSVQRCYTSELGFQKHMKAIDDWYKYGDRTGKEWRLFGRLRTSPNDKYIYWFPNDGFHGCFCKNCNALFAKHTQSLGTRYTQELYYLAKLAKYAKKHWSGKVIVYNLYGQTVYPAKEFGIPDNVALSKVFNTRGLISWKEKKYMKFADDLVNNLSKETSEKIVTYIHYPQTLRLRNIEIPMLAPYSMTKFYRKNRDILDGVNIDTWWHTLSHDLLMLYLLQSLNWNPDVDPDGVIDEYNAIMFGPAHKIMAEYHKILIDRWENVKWSYTPDIGVYGIPEKIYWTENYPTDVREKLQKLLLEGLSKTKKGSIYYDRMFWYNDAAQRFLNDGKLFDNKIVKKAECKQATGKIKIDGNLNEWKGYTPMFMKECMTGKDAKVKTEFYTAFDKDNFYIAGRVFEAEKQVLPPKVIPKVKGLWDYDSIEIFLCPEELGAEEAGSGLRGQYFQLILNSQNRMFEQYVKVGVKKRKKFTFNATHKTKAISNGWQFEVKIPLSSMNAITPKAGKFWAANFYRNRPRKDGSARYYAWSPTMGKSFFQTETFGKLEFPVKALLDHKIKSIGVWNPRLPKKDVTSSVKDGIITINIKNTTNKKEYVGFHTNGNAMLFKQPVYAKWSIRFNGKGVKKMDIWLRDKKWNKLIAVYNPANDPNKIVTSKDWNDIEIRKVIDKKRKRLDKIDEFYGCGITFVAMPGADFTLEAKDLKLYKK